MDDGGSSAGGAIAGLFMFVIWLVVIVAVVAGAWKMFVKAGKPGWAAIVPIYNTIVILEITGKPIWWIVLLFIPIVSIIIAIMVMIELAKAFGKGTGFGIGLVFLPFIFIPILGFGDAQYQGPSRS